MSNAIFISFLEPETINGSKGYKVKLSYGTFSIAPKVTQSGVYFSAYKRVRGKLYKAYVGKAGALTWHDIHKATMALDAKIMAATGRPAEY